MLRVKEGIEIVDKNGVPKIRLAIGEYGNNEFPKIEILDEFGVSRISIGVEDNSGKIGIYSESGNFAIGIGEDHSGGGFQAVANNDSYSCVHLIPIDGEYRLIISRKNNRQLNSDGSVSVTTAVFPTDKAKEEDS